MDRDTVSDRLPFGRLPGLGGDTEQSDGDTADVESPVETESAEPLEIDLDEPADTPSRRDKLRKLLLGVSLGGLGLAALAALLWRLLGRSDSADDADASDDSETSPQDSEAAEPDTEPPDDAAADIASELLTADAEGVAALIGLGFQLLVRALVDDGEAES